MGRLAWGSHKKRKVETGISKAVLYPNGGDGVSWNGIISITSSPEGADDTTLYADNFIYGKLRSSENLKGKIVAYQSPAEFGQCDGSSSIIPGLLVGQQSRKKFGLCYRTEIFAVNSIDNGYKIHIIYNATASPSEKEYSTNGDNPEVSKFAWDFSTVPCIVDNYKPFSEIILDSTKIDLINLKELESILYGTGDNSPYLPNADVVLNIVNMNRVVRMIIDVFTLHGHWRWDDFNFYEDTVPIAIDRESLRHIYKNPEQGTEYIQPSVAISLISADKTSQVFSVVVIDQKNPSELCTDLEEHIDLVSVQTILDGDFYYHYYTLTI